MSKPLILDSLGVRGFRAFNDLRIERLARVNLVVGKNNVGKTSLLEALWLYIYQGSSEIIWQILEGHDERRRPQLSAAGIPEERRQALIETTRRNYKLAQYQTPALRYLFFGRRDIREKVDPFVIGPLNSPERELSVGLGWFADDASGSKRKRRLVRFEDRNLVEESFLALTIKRGIDLAAVYRLDRRSSLLQEKPPLANCVLVDDLGLDNDAIGEFWDGIALTDLEEYVVRALRIIAPEVERLNLVGSQHGSESFERIPVVKVVGFDDPIPLRSLGEGMNRLFGIALALVNAKDGVLLVDEVESGLHYSAQSDVWRLIFETAHRLNVQVLRLLTVGIALKRSNKQRTRMSRKTESSVRLENRRGKIVATEFDERRLGIATREEIEVR